MRAPKVEVVQCPSGAWGVFVNGFDLLAYDTAPPAERAADALRAALAPKPREYPPGTTWRIWCVPPVGGTFEIWMPGYYTWPWPYTAPFETSDRGAAIRWLAFARATSTWTYALRVRRPKRPAVEVATLRAEVERLTTDLATAELRGADAARREDIESLGVMLSCRANNMETQAMLGAVRAAIRSRLGRAPEVER